MASVVVVFVFAGFLPLASVEELEGKVISVIDGNTFQILTADDEKYEVKLFGVDCPELGQPFADEAKVLLEKLILKNKITVSIQGKDKWGKRLVTVTSNKVDPRERLLLEGLAWTDERNPEADLETLRAEAVKKRKGIWIESNPTPPWIYRRQQTMLAPKSS